MRHLRDFGFGRRFQEFEIEVGHEMQNLVDMIKEGPKYEHEHVRIYLFLINFYRLSILCLFIYLDHHEKW